MHTTIAHHFLFYLMTEYGILPQTPSWAQLTPPRDVVSQCGFGFSISSGCCPYAKCFIFNLFQSISQNLSIPQCSSCFGIIHELSFSGVFFFLLPRGIWNLKWDSQEMTRYHYAYLNYLLPTCQFSNLTRFDKYYQRSSKHPGNVQFNCHKKKFILQA